MCFAVFYFKWRSEGWMRCLVSQWKLIPYPETTGYKAVTDVSRLYLFLGLLIKSCQGFKTESEKWWRTIVWPEKTVINLWGKLDSGDWWVEAKVCIYIKLRARAPIYSKVSQVAQIASQPYFLIPLSMVGIFSHQKGRRKTCRNGSCIPG